METVGEAVLVVSEAMEGTMLSGMEAEPFPVTRTVFFPKLDRGSSFFDRIFAYISLLNFVVISARRKCVKKLLKYT